MTDIATLPTPITERSVAYARMAKALAHLGDTWTKWPDLRTVADAMGLSPHHFQREFTRWAGISPKQYQAALRTLRRAISSATVPACSTPRSSPASPAHHACMTCSSHMRRLRPAKQNPEALGLR